MYGIEWRDMASNRTQFCESYPNGDNTLCYAFHETMKEAYKVANGLNRKAIKNNWGGRYTAKRLPSNFVCVK